MKLDEIIIEDQLDEIKLRHAVAAGLIAAAAVSPNHLGKERKVEPVKTTQQVKKQSLISDPIKLLDIVTSNYNISEVEAKKIISLVKKYENNEFSAADILAMIGIESSFNKNAVSSLKHDPAIGLTQIRPKVNGIKAQSIKGNVEAQIKNAVEILTRNIKRLGNKDDALHAYNVGVKNVLNNENTNPEYVNRWKKELQKYKQS